MKQKTLTHWSVGLATALLLMVSPARAGAINEFNCFTNNDGCVREIGSDRFATVAGVVYRGETRARHRATGQKKSSYNCPEEDTRWVRHDRYKPCADVYDAPVARR